MRPVIPLLTAAAVPAIVCSCGSLTSSQRAEMSPELSALLARCPEARRVLAEADAGALPHRGYRLRYAPVMRKSGPRSEFRLPFPNERQVPVVTLVSGLEPWDQFLLLVFELHNTRGKPEFEALWRRAREGSISREDFAVEVMRVEFAALLRVREIARTLPLTEAEKASSHAWSRLMGSPDDYADFPAYVRRVSPHRRQAREYHAVYDGLRGQGPPRTSFFPPAPPSAP